MSSTNGFMDVAFEQAKEALEMGEVPVGCCIVNEETGQVMGRGSNRTNVLRNATKHAEFMAVEEILGNVESEQEVDWSQYTLYVTVEPCIMCASAMAWLGIGKVVYGCTNPRFGGCGGVTEAHTIGDHGYQVVAGVDSEQAIQILQDFYERGNPRTEKGQEGKRE